MKRHILLTAVSTFLLFGNVAHSQTLDVQNYRTYDGQYNNPVNDDWGSAGTDLIRFVPPNYGDGISTPGGTDRPNPRNISNKIFNQDNLINDPLNISDFCWVFGQFLDHDIGLTPDGPEDASINIPSGDPYFDPLGTGEASFHVRRNIFNPETGTSADNPRQHPNIITAFIDGSGVYGSDEERAHWLRTFEGGKLKTSSNNLLPFNTISGEYTDAVDEDSPEMDNPVGISDRLFVAGDSRANENTLLASFHTLFVREHNRQCELIAKDHPDWNDEQIYQHARKMVGGIIQSITYEEWLPMMGVELPAYTGYDQTVNPQLTNLFTGAAYRLGHTLLSSELKRMDDDGEPMEIGHLNLRHAYFNPFPLFEVGGIDPYIRGMASQKQQMLDAKVIGDIRNFLFGPPGAGGLDLASINIQRGRERGIPDLNSIRIAYGLSPHLIYQQINGNAAVSNALLSTYPSVNKIDAWVGLLSEEHVNGTIFGETLLLIMQQQFTALRDGDRFYYKIDPVLSDEEKQWIEDIRFRDIVMYNTDITLMQDNIFEAMPHDEICDHLNVHAEGVISLYTGDRVQGINVEIEHNDGNINQLTNENGLFDFATFPGCGTQSLTLSRDVNLLEGVSTFDLVLIQKHILGISPLASSFQYIAADVNNSGSISTLDLVVLRKAILGINDSFNNNESWRFMSTDHFLITPEEALDYEWEQDLNFDGVLGAVFEQDFIAIKVGDINSSVAPTATLGERFDEKLMTLTLDNTSLKENGIHYININGNEAQNIAGFQFALNFDTELIEVLDIMSTAPNFSSDNFTIDNEKGIIRISWNDEMRINDVSNLFTLSVQAKQDGYLTDAISLTSEVLSPEAYTHELTQGSINLTFTEEEVSNSLVVYQNTPNPVSVQTTIPYYTSKEMPVVLTITDVSGKTVYQASATSQEGMNYLDINKASWFTSGIFFYSIKVNDTIITHKMIIQ